MPKLIGKILKPNFLTLKKELYLCTDCQEVGEVSFGHNDVGDGGTNYYIQEIISLEGDEVILSNTKYVLNKHYSAPLNLDCFDIDQSFEAVPENRWRRKR